MKLVAALFAMASPVSAQPPGKSTIAASHPMESMQFLLKYLPVAVAEDNGVGNYGHGAIQGRMQTVKALSYSAPNCQLYSAVGSASSSSSAQSMTPASLDQSKSVGSDCSYTSGKSYGSDNKMHMVYANNQNQCCNACISTTGCAAATFHTSSQDHSGGMGPQSWEGFGIHLPDVVAAETTGGLSVDALTEKYVGRLGDLSVFDAFMDYSVTFYTYNLQHYIDVFKADGVNHFLGQWKDGQSRQWYSLIFLVPQSTYVIELVSMHASAEAATLPQMEQRMNDEACTKWSSGKEYSNNAILVASVNRAIDDIENLEDVYTNKMQMTLVQKISGDVKKLWYKNSKFDICFTQRSSSASQDAIFSVKDHEDNMWAIHEGTMKGNPSTTDKMTDSHAKFNVASAGITYLKNYFSSTNFDTLIKNRLAYACSQSYLIDPTGFSIQLGGPGRAIWSGCSGGEVSV